MAHRARRVHSPPSWVLRFWGASPSWAGCLIEYRSTDLSKVTALVWRAAVRGERVVTPPPKRPRATARRMAPITVAPVTVTTNTAKEAKAEGEGGVGGVSMDPRVGQAGG